MPHFLRKLLVVEDDRDHAFLIEQALEHWAKEKGCVIELASTVEEALKKLQSNPADVILADYRLPDRTGLDLLEDLHERNLHIPMVLLTAVGSEELAAKAFKAGCFDYLAKSEHYLGRLAKSIETAYERHLKETEDRKRREELAQSNEELVSQVKKLAELSVLDDMTGVFNYRFLQEKLAEELARAKRYRFPLACLMIDIDHFKNVNDAYGHQTGDTVLKELAQFFLKQLRQSDTVARYGGEEFCLLLPHTSYEGAASLAERLRKNVLDQNFAQPLGSSVKIAISIGVSSYPEDPVDQKDTMIFYADKALYKAKSSGRNRVCLYQTVIKEYGRTSAPRPKTSDRKLVELRQRLEDISEKAKRAFIESTEAFIHVVEEREAITIGHACRVGRWCAEIGYAMGFTRDEASVFEHAGLLHDIGKACMEEDRRAKEEWDAAAGYEIVKAHPVLGFQIVKPVKFLSEEASIILHHEERYDGQGYPHHLKGKEIPVGARIVAVASAYDSIMMTESRDRKTRTPREAVHELVSNAGTQFDPEVVHHLAQLLLAKGELELASEDRERLEQTLKSVAA